MTAAELGALAARWGAAKLGGPGVVHVEGIEDPRMDVAALLDVLAGKLLAEPGSGAVDVHDAFKHDAFDGTVPKPKSLARKKRGK
jgi:hypothetical protein